nr:MAG TPA: hypothetical protein [Caudoviricetes sp.]
MQRCLLMKMILKPMTDICTAAAANCERTDTK